MNLWDEQPLPERVRPPIPPRSPWIGDVLGAIASCADLPLAALPESSGTAAGAYGLEQASANIVIMVDGLGLVPLLANMSYAPTLRRAGSAPVSAQTTAPSTTASALTTFATGTTPGATRMVGYSVAHGSGSMNLLHFADGVDARRWQPTPTIMERLADEGVRTTVVTDPKFAGSGLTEAAMRGAAFIPARTLTERFDAAAREARAGTPLIYVYWSAIDAAGHAYGPGSERWVRELEDFDAALGRFLIRVDGLAQVVLTADHGMVRAGRRVDISQVPELSSGVRILAGEGRAAHVHASPGREEDVISNWRDFWGEDAWTFTRAQIPKVLGAGAGVQLVGDLLVMPKSTTVVVDSRTQTAASIAMPGVHGSLTEDEMLIPVWRLV